MCEVYSSHFVCLSLCVSLFDFGEGSIFRIDIYKYNLGEYLSPLNIVLFFKSKLFWRKSEWNSAVTAVIYAGNAQSLNG